MPSGLPGDRRSRPGREVASLPVLIEWQTHDGALCRARGATRDISPGGVHCYIEQPLSPGLAVRFQVVFPVEPSAGGSGNFLCSGKVLRCQKVNHRFGVTVSIETRQLIGSGPAGHDRRFHGRIMPFASLPVAYPGLHVAVRDLSATGAFIEDERPLPLGKTFEMILGGGPLDEIRARSVVRRTEPHVGMAVEFVGLSKVANRRLQQFLEVSARKRAS